MPETDVCPPHICAHLYLGRYVYPHKCTHVYIHTKVLAQCYRAIKLESHIKNQNPIIQTNRKLEEQHSENEGWKRSQNRNFAIFWIELICNYCLKIEMWASKACAGIEIRLKRRK